MTAQERSYTIKLRSTPLKEKISDELLERFGGALLDHPTIAGPAPSADIQRPLGMTSPRR